MKHVLLLCSLVLLAPGARAQGENSGGFSFGAGLSFHTSSDNSEGETKIGFNVGGALEFSLGQSARFTMSFEHHSIPFDANGFIQHAEAQGLSFSSAKADPANITTAFMSFKFFTSRNRSHASSYFVLGGGYFGFSMSNFRGTLATGQTLHMKEITIKAAALVIGFGIDVPLGDGASFFTEISVCAAFAETRVIPFIPARGGLKINV